MAALARFTYFQFALHTICSPCGDTTVIHVWVHAPVGDALASKKEGTDSARLSTLVHDILATERIHSLDRLPAVDLF